MGNICGVQLLDTISYNIGIFVITKKCLKAYEYTRAVFKIIDNV